METQQQTAVTLNKPVCQAGAAITQGECWHGVEDPKERKRMQDRFAQRLRRQRKAKARELEQRKLPPKEVSKEPSLEPLCNIMDTLPPLDPIFDPSSYSSFESSGSPDFFSVMPAIVDPLHPVAATALPAHHALFLNGDILGLSCGMSAPSRSFIPITAVPASLYPSQLQLVTVHKLWIDRFPFPQFRENMLKLAPMIDDEQFLSDLFGLDAGKSFCVKKDGKSWEPRDWFMGKEMGEKWGWLFC